MSAYFDYNATTPLAPSVIQKINEALKTLWGNPSSVYSVGENAKIAIAEARVHVAKMIHAQPEDIIFTSGGTEANNMVIFGVVDYYKRWLDCGGSGKLASGEAKTKPHVITTNVEHDATILPLQHLESEGKIDVSVVPVGSNGCMCVEDIVSHIQRNTCLITVMQANNETGVVMPIAELGRALKKINKDRHSRGFVPILYHTDAAQALGKIDVDVDNLHVDYLTIVGHKFYGPRIGALYVRGPGDRTHIKPILYGGGQERGWRPGTENTAMIVGLGEAASLVHENLRSYNTHMHDLRDYLEKRLSDVFGGNVVKFNCYHSDVERLPNTCNMSIMGEGLRGYDVLSKCEHLMASVGAACHSQNKPSVILIASGVHPTVAANAIRLSVGRDTTKGDVDMIVNDLKQAVDIVKQNLKKKNEPKT